MIGVTIWNVRLLVDGLLENNDYQGFPCSVFQR